LGTTHRGIERILSYFSDVEEAVNEALRNVIDETESNATQKSKSDFHLPKI
jgi:hypothetical protein